MEWIRLLQIVVASPSDVQDERDALVAAVQELNRIYVKERRLYLNVLRWEDNAYAGFHADGPQGLIDAILRIPQCDVFIGIFWKRFGTPTRDGTTGTRHEFESAYNAWKAKGTPHIALYFSQKEYLPRTLEENKQQAEVLSFKANIPPEGLWWEYRDKDHFKEVIFRHLATFLPEKSLVPPEDPQMVQVGETPFPEELAEAGRFYKDEQIKEMLKNNPKEVREIRVFVKFNIPFKKKPQVTVSLQKIDAGDRIIRLSTSVEEIRLDGFTLRFATWLDSKVYSAVTSWVAVGE